MRTFDQAPFPILGMPVGPFAMNEYLIADPATGAAALVDGGGDPAPFLRAATELGCAVSDIFQTHAHIDHVAGLAATRAVIDAPIHLHPADRPLYDNVAVQARMFGMKFDPPPPPDRELAHGDVVTVGSLAFEVIFTPGHAPGHVCFWSREHAVLFAGDLLFRGSIGRTDLPGADPDQMIESLRSMLALPDETLVFPGHMEPTTIGVERRSNPFLRGLTPP